LNTLAGSRLYTQRTKYRHIETPLLEGRSFVYNKKPTLANSNHNQLELLIPLNGHVIVFIINFVQAGPGRSIHLNPTYAARNYRDAFEDMYDVYSMLTQLVSPFPSDPVIHSVLLSSLQLTVSPSQRQIIFASFSLHKNWSRRSTLQTAVTYQPYSHPQESSAVILHVNQAPLFTYLRVVVSHSQGEFSFNDATQSGNSLATHV
jgi:hypothetical protein